MHGDIRTDWSYASGPALTLLRFGLLGIAVLIIFSFSRRSGPVRALPLPVRAAPIEFLDALGTLYRSAGASSTAVAVALERFRRHTLRLCGQRPSKVDATDLAAIIRRRFPHADDNLEADLVAAEDASSGEILESRKALKLIQALHAQQRKLDEAVRAGASARNQQVH